MKKEFFKTNDLYFICENCGEMCDARGPKLCDNCGEQYTGHEILVYNEAVDKKQENVSKFQPYIAPPVLLRPDRQQQESALDSVNGMEELPLPRPMRLEQPVFAYSIYIYKEGQREDARKDGKPILFSDNVMTMGRESFLSDPRLFDNGLSMDGRFTGISRKNVVFIQKEEKLFIQYCRDNGRKKSKIYINGDKLEQGNSREIGDDDEILFGSIKDPEKCIFMCIHKLPKQSQMDKNMQGMMDQLAEGINSVQTQIAAMEEKIKSFTETIDPQNLRWKEGDSQESYDKRLDSMLPPSADREEELRLIREFFLWDTPQGQRDYSQNYSFMWEDRTDYQLAHYLYSAAFYEKVCGNRFDGTEHEDYYPACGSLGKAIEGFVREELAALIEQYLQPEFKKFLGAERSKKEFVDQGAYLTFLRGQNVEETERITSLFRKLDIFQEKEQKDGLREWRKAIPDFFKILKMRNKNAHPGSVCRKEEYQELKKFVLHSRAAWTIHQYYMRMVQKNG